MRGGAPGGMAVVSQFFFEALCGMILPCEQRCFMREATMAVSVKGVHCPKEVILMGGRWYAGVSAEHAPCRSTHGRTRGGGGSLHDEPGGIPNPATTSLPPGGTEADWIELGKIPAWHTPFSPLHSADVLQAVVFFSADHPGPPAGFAPGLLLRQLYAVFPRAKSHNCWAGQGNAGRWLQDWGR
jgi:hypothetical protein